MRRIRGLSNATKRLRGFGLAVIAVLTTAGLALVGFSGANANQDLGWDSEVDYAASLSISENRVFRPTSYSRLALPTNLNPFTVQMWVRPGTAAASTGSTERTIISMWHKYAITSQSGKWNYRVGDGSSWSRVNTNVPVVANQWTHLALVMTSSQVHFYVDGNLVHTSARQTSGTSTTVTIAAIGNWDTTSTDSSRFDGEVDEIKVWQSDRSSSISTDMHSRQVGAIGLSHYWDFNEGSGERIHDRVGNVDLTSPATPTSVVFSDVKQVSAASDGDTVITFPRTYLPGVGGWNVPENATDFRALVVAGGGAGGNTYDRPGAGGGGAGGYLEQSINELASTFTVKVGQGGQPDLPRTADPTGSGRDGQRSSLGSLEAQGGGGGGGRHREGNAGGSGGGAGGRDLSGSGNFGGNGTPGQGNSGGTVTSGSQIFGPGAGGGGALGQGLGSVASGDGPGKSGGSPRTSTLFSLTHSAGGDGGGAGQSSHKDGDAGVANSGNGGDGATSALSNSDSWGGSGGSGVVIVRYTPTIDAAVELDAASNNHLLTTSSLIPSIYTFEAWIRPTSFADYPVIYSQGSTGDSALWINNSGNPQVEWGGISAESITSYRIPLDEWTHVAVSKDGSSVPRLYINSSLIWTGAANSGSIAGQFKIGQWHANSNHNFIGEIDQVKIWNTALDATILAKSMHTYSTSGVTGTLVAHYDMNDADGSLELDRSGNGRHLTKVSILPTLYSSSNIAMEGTAHTEQNYVKFNRTYLTATGGWTPPAGVTRYKALVVAGGGAGGKTIRGTYENGGGGGAGGFIETEVSTSSSVHPVKVGQGGLGSVYPPTNGENSVVFNQTAIGGGRGGSYDGAHLTGADGGSGGGGANFNNGIPGGKGTLGQGFDGAIGNHDHNNNGRGGGGGGAGSSGFEGTFDGTTFTGGTGGFGRLSSISGIAVLYAGGGGGGAGTGGAGGSGIGGAGASSTNKSGQPGATNTGSGGGGSFADGTTTVNNGGSGGSGVVILSWGPYLEVSQSPTVARAGEEFREALKLRVIDPEDGEPFTGRYPVTVTASANVLTLNGVLLTQSYTVQSSADGTVDFSGLGFASNVSGDVTLTFTSDQFVGTSLVVTPNYFPQNVEIVASGTTGGTFLEGEFFATSGTGTTSITKDDLVAHLASYSTVISASGYVSVKTSFTSETTSDLVLKAGGYVNVDANVRLETHGGDIVLWADSDQSAGGYVRLLTNSEICTTGGTCGTTTTGGGDIVIGGGAADPNNPERPGGFAAGSGSTYDLTNPISDTTGIQLGRLGSTNTGPQLYSAGGDIILRGQMGTAIGNAWGTGIGIVGGTDVRSGVGKIRFVGKATYAGGSGPDGTMEFNAWGGAVNIEALNTSSEAVIIEGIENNSQPTTYGMWGSNDGTTITSAGGLILRANHVEVGLDLDLSVSGQIVIEPYDAGLRESSAGTSWTADFVNSNVTDGDRFRLLTPPSGIRVGSASNSNQVILNTSFTSAGDIEVIGGSISVQSHPQIISTGTSSKIVLKSRTSIQLDNGTSDTNHALLRTDNGDIVLWSDSDSNGTGLIYVGSHVTLDSTNDRSGDGLTGGGRITLAGSQGNSGVDADGHPLGAASIDSTSSLERAVLLGAASIIHSGGGKVVIRGWSNASVDTFRNLSGSMVNSGTGQILISVSHVSRTAFSNQGGTLKSASVNSPAIEILSHNQGASNYAFTTGGTPRIISTGQVDVAISFSAIVGSGNTTGIYSVTDFDFLSSFGEINITTNGSFEVPSSTTTRFIGAKSGSEVESSSADVTIRARSFADSTANTSSKISTSGQVQVLPFDTNFLADSTFGFDVQAGRIEFGDASTLGTAAQTLTIARPIDARDAIVLAGNAVTVLANATLKSSSTSGSIEILSNAAASLNSTITGESEVLVRSGSLAFNSASIIGTANVTLESQGTSYTTAPTSFNGLTLGTNLSGLTIGRASETGTITLNRAFTINGPITVHAGTINLQAAKEVTSESARVTLKSKGDIITTAAGDVTTDGGAIVLWSNSDGDSSSGGRMQVVTNSALISNGGDIVLAGGASQDSSGYPAGYVKSAPNSGLSALRFEGSANSAGGDVIFRGESAQSDATDRGSTAGVYIEPGASISSGAGDISISGKVPVNNFNTRSQWGLWVGDGGGFATIASTTGNIYMDGDASALDKNDNGGGFVTYYAKVTSQTGNVILSGAMGKKSANYSGPLVDITGWSRSLVFSVSTSGNVSVLGSAGGVVDLWRLEVEDSNRLEIQAHTLRSKSLSKLRANELVFRESAGSAVGTALLELTSGVTIVSSSGNVTLGRESVGRVSLSAEISISGDVSIQATNVSISGNVFAGGSTPAITISADVLDIDSAKSIKAIGGDVTLLANTAGRGIILGGTTTSALLEISDTELGTISATNLRVGDSSTSNIYVAGDITIDDEKVSNLIIRAAGNVLAQSGAKITAANLAIQAGGIVDLVGENAVGGNVALNGAGGVSYSSAVSYSPATVSGFTPVFGVGIAVSQTNSPTTEESNQFLAVTFNPPPQFVVTDSYSNTLDSNNTLAASYTVSATATNTSGSTGTVAGLNPSFSNGVYSFNSLRVDTNPGTYSFTVTVDDGISPFTRSSVDYNVQSGDPQQLIVTATDSTAPSGQASFSYAVSVQDQGGNEIVAGTNANLTVSASVSGAVLVSGGQVQANDSGVAVFTDLVITGSVSDQISISFFVEFTNNDNVFTTVSSAVLPITLTPGTPTQLRIDDPSQSVANRTTMSALVIDLLDAQGNIVNDRADEISVSIGSGSGATLVRTDALSVTGGASSLAQLTFNNLSLQGTVGSYRLDFESNQAGISSVSHDVTLTHGVATSLTISQVASTAQSGINISNQPEITIVDADDNPVLTGATASASISASVSGAGYATAKTGVDLSGATSLSAVSGVAAFGDLRLTGKAGSYTLSFEIPGTDFSVSQEIVVTAGDASKFKFIQLPQDVEAGQSFAQTVSVEILDATDNRVLTAGNSVNVDIVFEQNGDGGNFDVRQGFSPNQGLIEFNNLSINTADTYSLRVQVGGGSSPSGIAATTSPLFVVSPAGPSVIEWVGAEPTTGASNGVLDVQPSFVIKDQFNNHVQQAPLVTVSASVVSANSGDVVSILGSTATNSGNQFVNFSGLGLEALVGDYVLSFSAEVAAGVFASVSTSQPVTITHGSLSALVLVAPAGGAGSGLDFDDQPVLELRDTAGNRVSTSAQAGLTVRASQPGLSKANDGTDLGGTFDVAAQAGVVSFANLKLTGKVASYSLSYTVIGSAFSTSQEIDMAAGDPDSFRFLQQPTDFVAGSGFSPAVSAEVIDSEGNRVLSASNAVDVIWAMDGTGSYGSTSGFTPSNGVLDLSTLNFTKAASFKLRLEAGGLTSVDSDTFVIGHAAAAGLEWIVDPTGGWQSGKDITTLPKLRVVDQYNNAVSTGSTVTVSASVVGANSAGVLSVGGNEASGVEEIEFANLNITARADSYVFSFSGEVNGVTFGSISTSGTIDITHGDPDQLTIITPAAGGRAGLAFTQPPVLEIQDSAGNRVEDSSLTVTVTSSAQALIGTRQVNASAGTASFAVNLGLEGSSSNGITLTYKTTFNGQDLTTSQSIDLLAGLPSSLRVLEDASTVSTRAVFSPVPSVEVLDAYGNVVLSDNDSEVTVALYRNGVAISSESDPVTASSGVVAFSGLSYIATPLSNYKLQFSHTSISAVVTSSPFVIEPGPVAKVVIHQQPRTIAGGVTTTMTGELFEDNAVVRLYDIDDNLVHTVDSGVITAAISSGTGGTLISASAAITNGSATFNEMRLVGVVQTPEQSAQEYKLTFNYGAFSSSESDVLKVKHNLATQITMVTNASGGKASAIFTTKPKVRLLDEYGNWVSSTPAVSIQPVVFDESGLTSPSVFNAQGGEQTVNGEAEFNIGISGTTATTYRLEFIATSDQGEPITSASQSAITIGHGAAARLHILRNPGSDDGSGNLTKIGSALNVQPVIEIQDSDHNRVLDFNGVIDAQLATQFRGSRDYVLNHTVSAVAGVATFSNLVAVGSVTESYALSFYRLGLPSPNVTSPTFTLTHANAEYLTIETEPAGGNKTGSALSQSPTIAVRDFDGNITTTLNGSSVSAAVFSGGGSVDTSGSNTDKALVVNGIAQFSNLTVVALPGVDQTLQFTLDGAQNSTSGLVTSSASVTFSMITSDAFQLSVFTEPCTAADCTAGPTAELLGVQPVVEVQDRFGNRVEGFTGLVKATLQGTGGSLRDADGQISSRSVAVVNGLATFTDLRIEGVPGNNHSLQFETSGLQSTTSQDVQVIHTTPSQLVITQQPVGGVTGDELASQPVIEVRDRFNNLAVTDNSTQVSVSVFSGPVRESGLAAEVTGSLTVTAVNGVATFAGLELFAKTGENYVLEFATTGFDVLSNGVVVSPAGANRLEWVVEPVAQRTGEAMGTQPVLRMLDFDGNIASSTAATVVASVASGGGYIEAGTTSSAVEGIITFAGLTLVAAPNTDQTLTFTATTASGSFSITTVTPLNVQHTAASNMSIDTGYATSNEQGVVLGTQPVVKLYDRFNNLAVNDNSTVVSATIGSGAGGAVSGSATATAVGGVVTFAGLAVTGSPGVDYTLDFSAGGYGVSGSSQLRLYKTAALELSYSNIVYSSSPTTSPTIAFTDSTEHSISYSVSTPQFCTINATSGEVSIVGAGTCVIQASVADGTYYKATSKDVTLTIEKAQQDPVVISNNAFVNFGEALTLTATGGSSTKSTRFFANGECQILGDKLVTFGNATEGGDASCTIIASRGGDANYLSSTAAEMDIEIRRIAQQPISIGNNRNVSVGDVNLFIVGGSGNGTISYTVQSGTNNAQCSVTNGVLTADRNGSCEVSAQKALSANYNTASSPVVMFSFTKQLQQIEITSAPPAMPLPGQSYQVAATTSSGLNISYSITKGAEIPETSSTSFSPAVCALSQSVSGSVTFMRSGECEITATAPSSDRFASGTAKISILIGQLNQFITFDAISDKNYGAPSFRLEAEASSGLAVSFTVSSGVNVCSISNNRVTIDSAGTCEIRASQAGNGSYAPAPNVFRSFVVSPGAASAPSLISAAVGNQWFTVGFAAPSYDGGSSIMAYRLEVRDQNDNLYVTTTTDTQSPLSITAVGIPNNTPYTAKVAAITSAGVGQFSNTSVPLTPSAAAMSVTQLSADTSTTGLDLSWITPEAIQGSFQRYEIYAWVTGSEEPTSPTATLTNSASDQVSIDVSSISSGVSVSPASFTAPRLEIIQPLFQPNKGVHIFGASKTKPMGFISLASISQPSTASATVGYTMRVVTITDTASSSKVINTANGVKVGLSTPSAPTQLNLDTSDPTRIVATWAAPNSDGGFALQDYQVTSNGKVICANIQVRMCEISPLSESTTYNIEVKARNALGMGEAAGGSHTTPTPEPVITVQSQEPVERVTLGPIPQMLNFVPSVVRPGALVSVTGERLNTLESISIGGIQVEFAIQDAGALMFRIPIDMPSGRYSVIHTSTFGKVTVMDAITVLEMPVEEENEPVEAPETEVPVNPEATTPEAPVSPESGSQAPNSGGGASEGSGTSTEQPVDPETQEPETQERESTETSEPEPSPTKTSQPPTTEPESEEEVIAASPRDQAPVLEFGLSLAFIIAILLVLFVLRLRREQSEQD